MRAAADDATLRTMAAPKLKRRKAPPQERGDAVAGAEGPEDPAPPAQVPNGGPPQGPAPHHGRIAPRVRALVRAIEENDDAEIQAAILRLSRSRRSLAPLAFLVSAFALLFNGVKLLVSNWRLTLVQVLPAMWIWIAMYDLKAHVLHGKSFHVLRGAMLIPVDVAIIAITMACFFLNAVFALAISEPGKPQIRPALARARGHLMTIFSSGFVVGAALAFATTIATRQPHPWFTLSLSIVVGVMMVAYVAVPARIVGIKPVQTPREKLTTTAVGGLLGATVCTPPYLLGRLGILMLGSNALLIPGIFVLAVGVTLQAGATGAVRAIKMTAKLTAGRPPDEPVADPA
jgi:hypothetical protein